MLYNGATVIVLLIFLWLAKGESNGRKEWDWRVSHKGASRSLLFYSGDNRTAEEKLMAFGIESFGRILYDGHQTPCSMAFQSASTTGALISLCGALDIFDTCLENKTAEVRNGPQFLFICEKRTCLLVMSVEQTRCLLKRRGGLTPNSTENGECFIEELPDSSALFKDEEPPFFVPIGSQELPQCYLAAPEGTMFLRKLLCRDGKVRIQLKAILGGEEPLGRPDQLFQCAVDGRCIDKGFRADFICFEKAETSNPFETPTENSIPALAATPVADSPSVSGIMANSTLLEILMWLAALILFTLF